MRKVFLASVSRSKTRKWAVVLKDEREGVAIAVPLRASEAEAIATGLALEDPEPPHIHDLFLETLEAVGAELVKVILFDVTPKGQFKARLELEAGEQTLILPASASDAIALAVRAEADIYVTPQVLARAGQPVKIKDTEDASRFQELLGDLAYQEEDAAGENE
jgi:bifunctional DNase/RNase